MLIFNNAFIGEICEYIEEVTLPSSAFLLLKMSSKRIRILNLEVSAVSFCSAMSF